DAALLYHQLRSRAALLRFLRSLHEGDEQRVRILDRALILGVELRADIERVVLDLHDLYQARFRIDAGWYHASFVELRQERIIELVAMAMALADMVAVVNLRNAAAFLQVAGIRAKAHGAAHLGNGLLLLHHRNHCIVGIGRHLRAVRVLQAKDVPRELHAGHLHAEADAKEGNLLLPRDADRLDLAFNAARAEARGNE